MNTQRKHNQRRPSRRGSFLIFVVGVLALLAVVTTAYVTVGRADRRAAQTVVLKNRQGDLPKFLVDYIGSVLIEDMFLAEQEYTTLENTLLPLGFQNPERLMVRETTDYPYTNPQLVSKIADVRRNANAERFLFNPAGVGCDPWLGSTEPGWINADLLVNGHFNSAEPWRGRRDWMHISNFAPDGRFVNLVNLRNNFDATPAQMSMGLTLPDGDDRATDLHLAINREMPGATSLGTLDPDIPWHWSVAQRDGFRPIAGAYEVNKNFSPDDSEYYPNQWGDSDGDLMGDVRWFELVNAADDPNRVDWLFPNGELRWIVGVRAIDLTGLVNVNTATDLRDPRDPPPPADPSTRPDFTIGSTVADVDLRRLLSLQEFAEYHGHHYGNRGPRALAPANAGEPGNFTKPSVNPGTIAQAGERGYDELRRSLLSTDFTDPLLNPLPGGTLLANGQNFDSTNLIAFPDGYALNAGQREFYGRLWGPRVGNAGFIVGSTTSGSDVLVAEGFGDADLLELLTRFGVNDQNALSRLESMVDGRLTTVQGLEGFGPLRSVRADPEELLYRVDTPDRIANSFGPIAQSQSYLDPRHRLTTLSGARPLRPVFGRAVLNANNVPVFGALDQTELQRSIVEILDVLDGLDGPRRNEALHELFEAYADALLPYADKDLNPFVWLDPATAAPLATLHYGHRGPELALYIAAHMAVNMADLADDDVDPTCVTVLADHTEMRRVLDDTIAQWSTAGSGIRRGTDPTPYGNPGGIPWTTGFIYWGEGHKGAPGNSPFQALGSFDLNRVNNIGQAPSPARNRLPEDIPITGPTGGGDFVQSRVKNVYGIEPQPILTEVSSFTIYTDAPHIQNNEEEYTPPNPPTQPLFVAGDVTIDGDVSSNNEDFIAQIVAFQIHNPFDMPIPMMVNDGQNGSANASADWVPRYYIEFGGRFFEVSRVPLGLMPGDPWDTWGTPMSLANAQGSEPALQPGETRIYWAIAEEPGTVETRIQALLTAWGTGSCTAPPVLADVFQEFVTKQLADTFAVTPPPTAASPGLMPWIDPTNRTVQNFPGIAQSMDFFAVEPELTKRAHLWRRHFTYGENAENNEIMNDQLVDRLREPPPSSGGLLVNKPVLDRRITGNTDFGSNNAFPDCTDGNHQGPGSERDNTGLTLVTWASIRRPDLPSGLPLPRGAVPPWMIESKAGGTLGGTVQNVDDSDGLDLNSSTPSNVTSANVGETTPWGFFQQFAINPIVTRVNGTIGRDPDDKATAGSGVQAINPNLAGDGYYTLRADDLPLIMEMPGENNNFLSGTSGTPSTERVSKIRLADLLLPLGIGPCYDADPSLYKPRPASTTWTLYSDRYHLYEEQWTTLPEAIALALGYYNKPTERVDDIYDRAGLGVALDPVLDESLFDRGHLRLDKFVPFIDANGDGLYDPPVTGGRDIVMSPGVPLALNVLNMFTASRSQPPSLVEAERGKLNINTASTQVMRSLPMLNPMRGDELDTTNPNVFNISPKLWWSETGNAFGYFDQHTSESDIATTVTAYRDRLVAYPREPGPGISADYMLFEAGPGGLGTSFGPRQDRTQIEAIRTDRGFGSVGELLASRDRLWNGATVGLHDIDRLGSNNSPSFTNALNDVPNLESVLHRDSGGQYVPDELINEYDEKLTIANAVLGTATTRSDYFAVWFLIHGYAREDVEGLAADEAMVPTVARRFLVVYDRSNVVNPGDKPRVVLFEELPL